jgi:hypothetical protein
LRVLNGPLNRSSLSVMWEEAPVSTGQLWGCLQAALSFCSLVKAATSSSLSLSGSLLLAPPGSESGSFISLATPARPWFFLWQHWFSGVRLRWRRWRSLSFSCLTNF